MPTAEHQAALHTPAHAASNPAQHLMHFEGGNALSAFRAQALLPRLQAISARITGVAARFVHWVWSDAAIGNHDQLAALLHYGDAYEGGTDGSLVVVMPRLGTVSPWASTATDMARNCGFGAAAVGDTGGPGLHRVERVTEWRLQLKAGLLAGVIGAAPKPLSDAELQACAALLHDRMTESVAFEREAARHLFDERAAAPLAHVDVLGTGPSG
ncbi:MAG: phosphoribosylformylglycinamidine synthase, partial [Aquabacterium sp.]|nr:phosphoribosylformylglycinamidine synthase [Aquabacterium sp.]